MKIRWPALIWPGMSLASLYILIGTSGRWRPGAFAAGAVLALIVFGVSLYLATRPWPGGHRPRRVYMAMAGLGLWYIALAVAAGLAGPWYAVAGLAASLIPLSAFAIMVAVARQKTGVAEDGRLVDLSAEDDSPFPGIGIDEETPPGDTPERSEIKERQRRFERAQRSHSQTRR
jgi:hypothetical protein